MATPAITIDKKIADYLHLLNIRQKKTVLSVIKTFAEERKDWWDDLDKSNKN